AKERISALLPPASNKCLCGITVRGGIVRIDGKKSWVIDINQLCVAQKVYLLFYIEQGLLMLIQKVS
ncbi:MAG: hypothetical protein ACFNPZ_13080, partial [Fusobacterium polymorphum]